MVTAFGKPQAIIPEEERRERSYDGASDQEAGNQVIVIDRGVTTKKGMILPFQPLSMSFDDVNYSVDMPAVRSSPLCLT